MRAFLVRLPSGCGFWTVLDEAFRPHPEVDGFLLHVRSGGTARNRPPSRMRSRWRCSFSGPHRSERTGGIWAVSGRFVYWLQYYGNDPAGPVADPVRGPRRVNSIMAAVRSFLRHAVARGQLTREALTVLYESLEMLRPEIEFEQVVRQHVSGPGTGFRPAPVTTTPR